MKALVIVGIMLILFGATALVSKGVSYQSKEKILDVGPIEATTTKNNTIPFSPLLGAVSMVGGIALVVIGSQSKSKKT